MLNKLPLLFVALLGALTITAQPINVPSISSQYINQADDKSAVKLYLKYNANDKQAFFLIDKVEKDFSQATLNDYFEDQIGNLSFALAKQVAIQVHAPKDIPVHYLQSLYAWVQIQGNWRMHLVGREGRTLLYVPTNVMPFGKWEEACQHYAAKNALSEKEAIAILNTIHPQTETIVIEQEEELAAIPSPNKAIDYIPHRMLDIELKEGNNVYYKGQKVNPMVLGTMLQAEVAANYKGTTNKANPSQYFWINIRADKDITHEVYLMVLVAIQEGFYLYWDELAFSKYQKTYAELSLEESIYIKDTSPMLITQYDAIQYSYIKEKLSIAKGKTWEDLK